MKIVGITGTLGAGKGTIVEYLVNKKGFRHFSVREYLIREIKNRGMNVNCDSMTVVANDLRARNNPAFIIEELYREAAKTGKNSIIESIRTPGEIEFLRKQGNFVLLAVDADARLRYERISLRASETDKIDFQTFLKNEKREMTSLDINKQNLSRCIDMADIVLKNKGSIEELINQLPDFQD